MSEDLCGVNVVHSDRVIRASTALVSNEIARRLAETFKVLGDPTRIKIISALYEGELCVCDISAVVSLSQSAVSHQLGALRRERLVRRRRDGQKIFYSLDDEHIKRLLSECLDHVAEEESLVESGTAAG
ncbi:MAG: metalloregulator ArsR/SmtB family transcription factor [Actinobacteria bacterium]|nr:metalloregulator ArsR/SmtB family transcription factor [Actinomycetota bacterium]